MFPSTRPSFSWHTLLFLFIASWLPLPSLMAAGSSKFIIQDTNPTFKGNHLTFDVTEHGKVNIDIRFKRITDSAVKSLRQKMKCSEMMSSEPLLQDTFKELLNKELKKMLENGRSTSSYSYVPTGAPLDQTKTKKNFQKKTHETRRSVDNSKQQATKDTPPTKRTPSSHNGNNTRKKSKWWSNTRNKPKGSNTQSSQAKSEISSITADSPKGKIWRNKFVKRGAFAIALLGALATSKWYYWKSSQEVEKVNNVDAPNDKKEEKNTRHFRLFLSLCGLGLFFLVLYYVLRKRDI